MTQQISYATFFELAPGLLAIDRELDALGCPIAYRKYFAIDWLAGSYTDEANIKDAVKLITELGISVDAVASVWYNNVYGHAVYEPPASRLVALALPIPITIASNSFSKSAIVPDVSLIQYEIEQQLTEALKPDSVLLLGIQKFQALPIAKWVWLAMADYDISVRSFELTRPAYHLSLWHTFQALEKLLKATLLSFGENEQDVRKCNHSVARMVEALKSHGLELTAAGRKITGDIENLVGGPGVRYLDDTGDRDERLALAGRALQAHHLLLRFFVTDCETLASQILSSDFPLKHFGSIILQHRNDEWLRKQVHEEHESRCSHEAYSIPSYALPTRHDIKFTL